MRISLVDKFINELISQCDYTLYGFNVFLLGKDWSSAPKEPNLVKDSFPEVFDWELISVKDSARVTAEQLKSMNQI